MDDVEQLKQDVRDGRIDPERLIGLLVAVQRQLQASINGTRSGKAADRRIRETAWQVGDGERRRAVFDAGGRAAAASTGEEAGKRKRPMRRGRMTTADKIRQAERTEKVFPAGVAPSDCQLSHTRPVWRLENGRAVLVAYEVYRGPKNQYGKIPGTLGRSEFGIEIILAIAYQVYIVGLSFDKVCLLMNFFQNLRLRKSQVDSLLHQLSRHWQGVRSALHVAGEFGGGACRRNELEPP